MDKINNYTYAGIIVHFIYIIIIIIINFYQNFVSSEFFYFSLQAISICGFFSLWHFFKSGFLKVFFYIMEAYIILMVGYAKGPDSSIPFSLACMFLFQTAFFIPFKKSLILSSLFLLIYVFFSHPISNFTMNVFGYEQKFLDTPRILSLFFKLSLFFIPVQIGGYLFSSNKYYDDFLKRNREIMKKLSNTNQSYLEYASFIDQKSMIDERNRITRELHDISGHIFTNIITLLRLQLMKDCDSHVKKLHTTLLELAQEGLNDTRQAVRDIRSREVKEKKGLQKILKLVMNFEKVTGIRVSLNSTNTRLQYSEAIDMTVYRIIQESLTNSLTHGHATKVDILLQEASHNLRIHISDNGKGAAGMRQGVGFASINERLTALSGDFHINKVDMGFSLSVSIPLETVNG